MAANFFFYDLETTGVSPREARVVQCAGQRTDMQLRPVDDPFNIIVRLSDEVLPEPDAVLVTGITPQKANADGVSEAEFLRIFTEQIATPDTIFTGYNTVRFDDEFVRFAHYRNFYDPYAWQWQDNRGRWDLLDVVRMTRALRPEGINWPFTPEGKPTNRLELITDLNGLEHTAAHDALSDVRATIGVARLILTKQPRLFEYLLDMRDKRKVSHLVGLGDPFVYTSGRYASEFEKTTVAVKVVEHPRKQGAQVYDLRHDPTQFLGMKAVQLADIMRFNPDREALRLPVKTIQYNRCPAVAPMAVLNKDSQERLQLDLEQIRRHHAILKNAKDFGGTLLEAMNILDKENQAHYSERGTGVDSQLYDGFIPDADKTVMSAVRASDPHDLADFGKQLKDERLRALLPLYKARTHPDSLTAEERTAWDAFRTDHLMSGGADSRMQRFFVRLQELAATEDLSTEKRYLLEELQLYAQSIMPVDPDY